MRDRASQLLESPLQRASLVDSTAPAPRVTDLDAVLRALDALRNEPSCIDAGLRETRRQEPGAEPPDLRVEIVADARVGGFIEKNAAHNSITVAM